MSSLEQTIAKRVLPPSVLSAMQVSVQSNPLDKVPEQWAELLGLLKTQGFEAEVMTKINIKPVNLPEKEETCPNRLVVRNIIQKQSSVLSQKLREDFSLRPDECIDFTLLSGSLAEFFDEDEDSSDVVKSSRRTF